MINIYDIVEEIYTDDGGWNTILDQKNAEQFLRKEAFRGASDDELVDIWQQVMYILIYCGNTNYKIGDLNGEDLVYCISWCQRNIADFELDYESVDYFLSVIDRLLAFLKQKKDITSDTAAKKCRLKLLGPDKTLNLFRKDGSLPEAYDRFRTNQEPDLETKVFMQLGKRLFDLFDMMRAYFNDPCFDFERRRACFSFFGMDVEPTEEERPDLYSSFWEFFILDFHLGDTNQRPVELFYEYYKEHPDSNRARSNKALISLLETMLKIRLMLFTVEGESQDGWFRCRDFFDGSISELSLPIDDAYSMKHMVCLAHVFEDGNLFTEYLRSVYITPVAQKALHGRFSRLLSWYRIRNPQADWEDFCAENPALVNHMTAHAGMKGTVPSSFRWTTKISEYKPAVINERNDVNQLLRHFGALLHIAWQDCRNLLQLWSDFIEQRPVICIGYDDFMIWSLAALDNYMYISKLPLLDIDSYVKKMRIAPSRIDERSQIIRDTLELEPFDPRYSSEEVLMSMMFS